MSETNDSTRTTSAVARPPAELSDKLERGDWVGDYRVETLLGAGGCARVYKAQHGVLGRAVAIKVLHGEMANNPLMVERFMREARIVNKLRHPAIVDIHGFGSLEDGRPYFVMEHLEGRDLGKLLMWLGRMRPSECVEYLEPLVSALSQAHAINIVHRDVKPSNIMVIQEGSPPLLKLLDFGIAKLLRPEPGEPQLTTELMRLGSSLSMAPEQILGQEVDQRCDVYALGVLLFYMLTGRRAFADPDPVVVEFAHLNRPVPRPSDQVPGLSTNIDRVVMRAMAKARVDRFGTAREFLDGLKEAVHELSAPLPRAATRKAIGLAILVSVRPNKEHLDDEDLLERASAMLEPVGGQLSGFGLILALETGDTLLAMLLLSDAQAERASQTRRVVAMGEAVLHKLRQTCGAELQPTVVVHVDEVELKVSSGGALPGGGPLFKVNGWPAPLAGAVATPQASARAHE